MATRVWVYDSPALYGDIWMALGRAAEATPGGLLGTGVAIPSLRHAMVTAPAIGAIEELAPGRLTVAFGTGFTARQAMGKVAYAQGRPSSPMSSSSRPSLLGRS